MTATTATQGNATGFLLKATLLVTSTLTVMAGATVAPSIPGMGEAFADVPNSDLLVRLVLTVPALFIVLGAPLAGAFVDRFGRKPLLVFSVILYGLAGGSGYLAPTLPTILIGRALLGLAVAGLMTSVTTLITDYFQGDRRASFLGLQAAFMGLGGTVFLSIGGVLADVDWRAPFLIYLSAFTVLPFVVGVLYEPRRQTTTDQPDDVSLSDLEVLPLRLVFTIYLTIVLIQSVFYIVVLEIPDYLLELVGAGGTEVGLATGFMAFVFAMTSLRAGWFNKRLRHTQVITLAFLLVGVAYALIAFATDWTLILPALALVGLGTGVMMPNLNAWLASLAPSHLRGRVMSGYTTAIFLGQFLSPLITDPIKATFDVTGTFLVVSGLLAALAVVAFVVSVRVQTPQPVAVGGD